MQIYYYTRTKRSEEIAIQLSKKYSASLHQIKDNQDWQGVFKFFKAGAMASGKKMVEATYDPPNNNEKIILVFPVWAGTLPPAIRDFVGKYSNYEIIAITTSLGTGLKDKDLFTKVIDLIGKNITIDNINEENFLW